VEKACANCGKAFRVPQSLKAKLYCSRACYEAHRTPEQVGKVCPVCGKSFTVAASIADRYTICSWECRTAETTYAICARCGKQFTVHGTPSQGAPYCSEECRRPPLYIDCAECGKRFRAVPTANRVFCSASCYRRHQGETGLERAVRIALSDLGLSFRQEVQIGRYAVDFVLPDLRIAIEADGAYWHANTADRDARKTRYLARKGWRVLRLGEIEVNNAANLCQLITERINEVSRLNLPDFQPSLL
jgi:very-short-patch-repair endonuclease